MTPYGAGAETDWAAILALIQSSFAYMDSRIDPPSSMHALTPEGIVKQAETGEVWLIGVPAIACVFLTPKPGALYIGKLAVAAAHRGRGHARALIDLAETRARVLGLPRLDLQTRVELVENQAAFAAMGFVQTAATAHPGYDRPTSFTLTRLVDCEVGASGGDILTKKNAEKR